MFFKKSFGWIDEVFKSELRKVDLSWRGISPVEKVYLMWRSTFTAFIRKASTCVDFIDNINYVQGLRFLFHVISFSVLTSKYFRFTCLLIQCDYFT